MDDLGLNLSKGSGSYILHTHPQRREWGVNESELEQLWNGGTNSVAREMFLMYCPLAASCAINTALGFFTGSNMYVVAVNFLATIPFAALAFYFYQVSQRDSAGRKVIYDKIVAKPPLSVTLSVKEYDPQKEGFPIVLEAK